MADEPAAKRNKGMIFGFCLIAFGIAGAIVGYVQDSGSFDIIRMTEAGNYAMLHLVLWTIAGLAVIAWNWVKAAEGGHDDDPPERFRD